VYSNKERDINILQKEFTRYLEGYLFSDLPIFPATPEEAKPLVDWHRYTAGPPPLWEVNKWLKKWGMFNIGLAPSKQSRTAVAAFPSLKDLQDWFWSLNTELQIYVPKGLVVVTEVENKPVNAFIVFRAETGSFIPRGLAQGRHAYVLGDGNTVYLPPSKVQKAEYRLWQPHSYLARNMWVKPLPDKVFGQLLKTL
jgi:hypothetical protein